MQEMIGYVYKTTNLVNGKIYIGQHIAQQFEPDKYIGSGSLFLKALSKYGFENFKCELLAWAPTVEILNKLEIEYIEYYNARQPGIGYNLCKGGKGGNLGYIFTEDQKKHLSEVHTGLHQNKESIKKQADKLRNRIVITNGMATKLIDKDLLAEYEAAG